MSTVTHLDGTYMTRLATSEGEVVRGLPFTGRVYRDGHEIARFTSDCPGTLNQLVQQQIHGTVEIHITNEIGEPVRFSVTIARRGATLNGPDALAERARSKKATVDALREEADDLRRARNEAQHEATLLRQDYNQLVRECDSERATSRQRKREVERLSDELREVKADRQRLQRELHEERRRRIQAKDEHRSAMWALEQKQLALEHKRQMEEIDRKALERKSQRQERTISELRSEIKTLQDGAHPGAEATASRGNDASEDVDWQEWMIRVLAYLAGLYSPKVFPMLLERFQPEQKEAESEEALDREAESGEDGSL